ncbi:MAG: synthase [Verrucomicrobia bacterium]|nr:synthase [Verrucomicrobiota bacterium]
MKPSIALVGDYSAEVIAHRAIPRALELANGDAGAAVGWTWVHTRELRDPARDLANYSAVWVVPRSPYENMAGVLDAIRWARETKRPLLGSCGGFQHLVIEFARNRAGIAAADHAETNPDGPALVVEPLACSLVEQTSALRFTAGSRLREIYGCDATTEGYHCRYGVNPLYRAQLERAGLKFTAFDETGEIRGAELPAGEHPFFIGTLFQSERRALKGEVPPLARALVQAAGAFA